MIEWIKSFFPSKEERQMKKKAFVEERAKEIIRIGENSDGIPSIFINGIPFFTITNVKSDLMSRNVYIENVVEFTERLRTDFINEYMRNDIQMLV